MIDRAVKRLVQIKVMKQMLGQTGTERTDNRSGKVVKLSLAKDTSLFWLLSATIGGEGR